MEPTYGRQPKQTNQLSCTLTEREDLCRGEMAPLFEPFTLILSCNPRSPNLSGAQKSQEELKSTKEKV